MNLDRATLLFWSLSSFFIGNALLAELIGVKIFALEDSLGLSPFGWTLFGHRGSLDFTAGVLLWPVVFLLTDLVNEYFGPRGVYLLSWMTVGLICYAFVFAGLAIALAPASWWITIQAHQGVPDMQAAFAAIFGQGMWTIVGSVTAFALGQAIDALIFQRVRRFTGERHPWARATGSTLISQGVDSFVVLYIAFVLGPQRWPLDLFLAVGTVNYLYKVFWAIALTPVLYLGHAAIDRFLGAELAQQLRTRAAASPARSA